MDDGFLDKEINEIKVGTEAPDFRKPGILKVSILFSISVIVFVLGSLKITMENFYLEGLVGEVALVLLPAIIFLIVFKYDIKSVLRLNKIKLVNASLIVAIMGVTLFLMMFVNGAYLMLIKSIFGQVLPAKVPVAEDITSLILSFIVIGLSAAVCEEVLFRGVIQRGFEKFGTYGSIFLTAFLFALMHRSFQSFLGTFLLGALIGFIVYRTNSLYGGMIAHFTNNSAAVMITFAMNKLTQWGKSQGFYDEMNNNATKDLDFSYYANLPRVQLIITLIFVGFIFIMLTAGLIGLLYAFKKYTHDTAYKIPKESHSNKAGLLTLIPGIGVIAFFFYLEGLRLLGQSTEVYENFIKNLMGLS